MEKLKCILSDTTPECTDCIHNIPHETHYYGRTDSCNIKGMCHLVGRVTKCVPIIKDGRRNDKL